MRLLGGTFGSSPLVVVGGIFADVWDSYRRGQAMAMFSATTFLGPTLGKLTFWNFSNRKAHLSQGTYQ